MKKTSCLRLLFIGVILQSIPISSSLLALNFTAAQTPAEKEPNRAPKTLAKAPAQSSSAWQGLSKIGQHKRSQQASNLFKRGESLGSKAVSFAKNIASPVKALEKQYDTLINKYINDIALGKIDAHVDKFSEESIKANPHFEQSVKSFQREAFPNLKKRFVGFIDTSLKQGLKQTTNSLLIPFLARTYDVPLETISYSSYENSGPAIPYTIDALIKSRALDTRYNEKELEQIKKSILEDYRELFRNQLDYLNLDRAEVTEKNLDSIIPELRALLAEQDTTKATGILDTLQKKVANEATFKKKSPKGSFFWSPFKTSDSAKLTSAPQEQRPIDITTFKQMLFKAKDKVIEKYHKNIRASSLTSYTKTLKEVLLPKILLTHFNNKEIPGVTIQQGDTQVAVVINAETYANGDVVKAIHELEKKLTEYKEKADTLYKKYQKFVKVYGIIINMTEALGTTIELSNNPNAGRFFYRVADALAKTVQSLDDFMDILNIQTYELGAVVESSLFPNSSRSESIDPFEGYHKYTSSKDRKHEKLLEKSHGLKGHEKALGTLRFILQKYKSLHSIIIQAFVEELDAQGEKIFTLDENRLIATAKKIIKPKVLDYLQGKLKDLMIQRFGDIGGPMISTIIIDFVRMVSEEGEKAEKEEMTLQQQKIMLQKKAAFAKLK